ncbi:MAG: tetratricopeptide repeat protein [Luteolibacter sp.]
MHTFWTTFYSYKGGVGRSMALANVAASLASSGRRVMMIDFDLEAPGLDSFEEFGIPQGKVGVVEYVCHYLRSGQIARIEDHVHEIRPLDLSDPDEPKPQPLEGKLWLMTSGAKNDSYNEKRLSINWADLYENHSGGDFFDNFKAEIEETYRPDYVLVDSRTGLTDVGGVCTLHLPDLVVLLFSLNEQNLQGIASVARVLRDSEKFPQIVPVATPVPNIQGDGEGLLERRMERAKELLGAEVKRTLSYSPTVALKERILVWGRRPMLLSLQYGELAETLRESNPGGLDFLRREADAALESLDVERAEEIGKILSGDYSDRADSWLTLAQLAMSRGDAAQMEMALFKALDLSPGNQTAYQRIHALLKTQKRYDDLLKFIGGRIESNSDSRTLIQRLGNRGEVLMKLGRPTEALADYERAIKMKKNEGTEADYPTLFNVAEARRRATGVIHREEWSGLVKLFEAALSGVSSLPSSGRANQTQAMHIAYACTSNLAKADSLLEETAKVLQQASPQERVFCVADYDHLPLRQFLIRNREMKDSLARGELWDGMKVG